MADRYTNIAAKRRVSNLMKEYAKDEFYRILSLDGGGAKGFYTLGVLKEIEAMLGCPLYKRFDLVFGTSTGAIIAALIALGSTIDEIHDLYREHVPTICKPLLPRNKTKALNELTHTVFKKSMFTDVKTGVGIVATKWVMERPMIFKGDITQAHGMKGSFIPGFGVTIADAVQASCSAYPFFKHKTVTTKLGDKMKLGDGGYCANNPTLYAIADAVKALNKSHEELRIVSVGVGVYPQPKTWNPILWGIKKLPSVQLLQKSLEINTQSMDQLRLILFKHIQTIRINDTFEQPEMATDLMEHDLDKLNILRQRGRESFAKYETELKNFLI